MYEVLASYSSPRLWVRESVNNCWYQIQFLLHSVCSLCILQTYSYWCMASSIDYTRAEQFFCWMVVTSYCVNVAPTLLLLFSWKSGNVDKEREREPLHLQWLLLVCTLVTICHSHLLLLLLGEDDHGEESAAAGESITGWERAATRLETTLRSQARGPGVMLPRFWWRPNHSMGPQLRQGTTIRGSLKAESLYGGNYC